MRAAGPLVSSTCAYQGCAGGFGIEKVVRLAGDCLDRVWADLTVVLDIDPHTASKRRHGPLDRMEQKGAQYHLNVRRGFLQLARMYGDHVKVVDAAHGVDAVHRQVRELVERTFPGGR